MIDAAHAPLVSVTDLATHFPIRRGLLRRQVGAVRAVDGVGFTIPRGRTLGLVGESGCGKTTVGRSILRLVEPTAGSVTVAGRDVRALRGAELRQFRRRMQIVFQDPHGSLNPRKRIGQILEAPLEINTELNPAQRAEHARAMLALVGLRVPGVLVADPACVGKTFPDYWDRLDAITRA